jgi:hypothetical protein
MTVRSSSVVDSFADFAELTDAGKKAVLRAKMTEKRAKTFTAK